MENLKIIETGYEIFISRIQNRKYPHYLKNLQDISNPYSVKKSLTTLSEVIKWDSNDIEILVDSDNIYQSLANEVYAYYTKSKIQKKNLIIMEGNNEIDFTWMYTTQYYFFYYIACVMNRLNNYFVIYLEDSLAKEFSSIATDVNGEIVNIAGNSTYFIKIEPYREQVNKVKVIIKKSKNQHQSTWDAYKSFLKEYKSGCQDKDGGIEKNIIINICKYMNKRAHIFSESRNYYNYRFETVFEDQTNRLWPETFYLNSDEMWTYLYELCEIESIEVETSSHALKCISEYFYIILERLITKMYEISEKK